MTEISSAKNKSGCFLNSRFWELWDESDRQEIPSGKPIRQIRQPQERKSGNGIKTGHGAFYGALRIFLKRAWNSRT